MIYGQWTTIIAWQRQVNLVWRVWSHVLLTKQMNVVGIAENQTMAGYIWSRSSEEIGVNRQDK